MVKPIETVEHEIIKTWKLRNVDYETPETADKIRASNGSQAYSGLNGKWLKDGRYVAVNGHASRGGSPLKLKTSDGILMPISNSDVKNLQSKGFITGSVKAEPMDEIKG